MCEKHAGRGARSSGRGKAVERTLENVSSTIHAVENHDNDNWKVNTHTHTHSTAEYVRHCEHCMGVGQQAATEQSSRLNIWPVALAGVGESSPSKRRHTQHVHVVLALVCGGSLGDSAMAYYSPIIWSYSASVNLDRRWGCRHCHMSLSALTSGVSTTAPCAATLLYGTSSSHSKNSS